MKTTQQVLDLQHLQTQTCMHNLASIHIDRCWSKEVGELLAQVVNIIERDGDKCRGAKCATLRHAEKHGTSGIDVQRSTPIEGCRRARV